MNDFWIIYEGGMVRASEISRVSKHVVDMRQIDGPDGTKDWSITAVSKNGDRFNLATGLTEGEANTLWIPLQSSLNGSGFILNGTYLSYGEVCYMGVHIGKDVLSMYGGLKR